MNNNKRALLVEDYKTSQNLFILFFSQLNWESPVIVSSGESALEILKQDYTKFDVIILDLKLPGIDGFEVFARAKNQIPDLPPVIMITGNIEEDTKLKEKAEVVGIDAFIFKNKLTQEAFQALLAEVAAKKAGKYEQGN